MVKIIYCKYCCQCECKVTNVHLFPVVAIVDIVETSDNCLRSHSHSVTVCGHNGHCHFTVSVTAE